MQPGFPQGAFFTDEFERLHAELEALFSYAR
jgi:hypothetical protein